MELPLSSKMDVSTTQRVQSDEEHNPPIEAENGATTHIQPLELDLTDPNTTQSEASAQKDAIKLCIGAGGIYAAFLYYGSLQEDVFLFKAADGSTFQFAWFLSTLEAAANTVVGYFGRKYIGGTDGLPMKQFAITGASQVFSKAFTSLALAKGLSFPVTTLAKSGKMAPVMAGQLLLGGASYSTREYLQVVAIIFGTVLLSLGKKKGGPSQSTPLGLVFILLSLVMDGVTGGVQKRLKADMSRIGMNPKPYDFMFYTNISMCCVAFVISLVLKDFSKGYEFCVANPAVLRLVVQFSICSAIGQSFIFYTVAHFDPLVCSTVTTTRKIFSVLLSIFLKGHKLTTQGWTGVSIAVAGILSEVYFKTMPGRSKLKAKTSMAV